MNRRWFLRVAPPGLAGVAALMSSTGCGYALAGRGSFLPAYVRTVGIPLFENRTTFSQVEQTLTEKVRAEFIGRGRYAVVPQADGSDAVVRGEITGFSVQAAALTDRQLASRYLFILTLRVQFVDTRTNEVLWSNDAFTFRDEYELQLRSTTTIDGTAFFDQERSAVDRLSTDIARTVVTAISEAF